MRSTVCTILAFAAALCSAQQACEKGGDYCKEAENPPAFTIQKCTVAGGCAQDGDLYLTMDANWRWTQKMGTWQNCWDEGWIDSACSDESQQEECATSCMLEGVNYPDYGVTVSGDTLKMTFIGSSGNVGARMYVIEKTGSSSSEVGEQWQYKPFDMRNKEITMTIDASTLTCGINGPSYFVEMPLNGGYDGNLNTAGAVYGTGYCDAQCPGDIKFVNGKANIPIQEVEPPFVTESSWKACCAEMDIYEGNTISNALTPHPVAYANNGSIIQGLYACGDDRDVCRTNADTAGCDWATYRLQYYNGGSDLGDHNVNYYGEGNTIDTNKPFTLVTQFLTADGTDTGDLSEIRRYYVQDGVTYEHMTTTIGGKTYDSLTDEFCDVLKDEFDNGDDHWARNGGMFGMGDAFSRGMTLVLSLWDDVDVNMRWLDGKFPTDEADSTPGAVRGTCEATEGPPSEDRNNFADVYVTYSAIKWGEIGSTFDMPAGSTPTTPTPPVVTTPTPVVTTPTPVVTTPTPVVTTPTPVVTTPSPPAEVCKYDACTSQASCGCAASSCYELISGYPMGMCMASCTGWSCSLM